MEAVFFICFSENPVGNIIRSQLHPPGMTAAPAGVMPGLGLHPKPPRIYPLTARPLRHQLRFAHPFDIRTDAGQLLFDLFMSSVDVVNAVDADGFCLRPMRSGSAFSRVLRALTLVFCKVVIILGVFAAFAAVVFLWSSVELANRAENNQMRMAGGCALLISAFLLTTGFAVRWAAIPAHSRRRNSK
jgi:hypothetical protein